MRFGKAGMNVRITRNKIIADAGIEIKGSDMYDMYDMYGITKRFKFRACAQVTDHPANMN